MSGQLTLERPWLSWTFDAPQRVLSWAINKPGFVETHQILWREVHNSDLPRDFDVDQWFFAELNDRNAHKAVSFLTSRDVSAFKDETVVVEDAKARCVATVGLSNAEAIGSRMDRSGKDWGTINVAIATNLSLTDAARIEALSIVAQARTVAVMQAGLILPTGLATGTGTDCIAVAAPVGDVAYAGLHTSLGEAIGQAVLKAVTAGVTEWMKKVYRERTG